MANKIRTIPMATRPATLDGKTVYIVDTKYPNTKPFVESAISFSHEIHESIL